ncbi:MFS transporter [Paenibacillus aurantius]|uniref:MFS transporter n=1 Tax=Paenibacillus aurantius TaxID=2918900 RepID=A0AA96LBE3_9BACL|nr:MFS transporter [Paenibacillus aurantius]WNQ10125.1 MFS transporter [Paenibacillus aurantius]
MWRNRNVWIIWSGEMVAGLGLWMSIIANLEFMQRYVPSDFMKSLILFAGLLAGVLVGPLAGRVIDASRKKTVLLYAGFGRMLSVAFMFLALHYSSVGWMVVFAVVLQISAAFYFPALQALVPMVVKEEELLAMNGVHMNVGTVSRILGTALGGAMLAVMSLYTLYMASLVAYVLLQIATWFLSVQESASVSGTGILSGEKAGDKLEEPANGRTAGEGKRRTGGFAEILPLLKTMPVVKSALLLTIVPTLFIGGFNLMVINISELQNNVQIKGLLYTVEGTSFILGALLVKRFFSKGVMLRRLLAFSLLIAVAQSSLFYGDHRIMSMVSFGLFGLCAGGFFPVVATIFQTGIPKEYHGRFFSFRAMFDRVLFQVVLLGTGFLLDTIGFKRMVLVFGGLSLLLTAYYTVQERRMAAGTRPVKGLGEPV